jgi:hypothetical protein
VADAETERGTGSGWDRYWFGEGSLVRLGAFRIVMLLTALYAVQQNRMGVFEHADEIASEFTSRVWDPIYAFQVTGGQTGGGDDSLYCSAGGRGLWPARTATRREPAAPVAHRGTHR